MPSAFRPPGRRALHDVQSRLAALVEPLFGSHLSPGNALEENPSQTDTACRRFNLLWWRGEDSNLRRLSRQIYSLIPLATREPLQKRGRILLQVHTPVNTASINIHPRQSARERC